MSVLVVVDAHLFRTPDGKVWTKTIYGYDFWQRYLEVFENINVVSRMKDVSYEEVKGYLCSSGDRINFYSLPMANTTKQYLKNVAKFIIKSNQAVQNSKCCILRLPSFSGIFVYYQVKRKKIPFVIEVVADPKISLRGKRSMAGKYLCHHLKKAVQCANGVSYVTQYALQEKYPSYVKKYGYDNLHFETYYSSINLCGNFFSQPRDYRNHRRRYRLVHIANNIGNYEKGHKESIDILSEIRKKGKDVELVFIGEGAKRKEFEEYAISIGMKDFVLFTGLIFNVDEIRAQLLDADIFILPTKAEGLPRAIIEAMAVGLPCLSTPVNGIPELLEKECLFEPDDIDGFTEKIEQFINRPETMNEISRRNIEKAREYEATILQAKRNDFYSKLKK